MTSNEKIPSNPPQGETYGDAVKRLLKEAGQTQEQFAAAKNMTTTKVSRALDNKITTHSPTDAFHDAVLAFLRLDKDSEKARYLKPLYEAARNEGGKNYWEDESNRWMADAKRLEAESSWLCLTVEDCALRVEAAIQDRDAARGRLGELQEQLALLGAEMERRGKHLESRTARSSTKMAALEDQLRLAGQELCDARAQVRAAITSSALLLRLVQDQQEQLTLTGRFIHALETQPTDQHNPNQIWGHGDSMRPQTDRPAARGSRPFINPDDIRADPLREDEYESVLDYADVEASIAEMLNRSTTADCAAR